jgi:hypothetical protein
MKVKKSASILLLSSILLILVSYSYAQRADIVILKNGSNIVGEIRKLDRGKLEFKTDNISTIYIEWEAVDFIQSKDLFDIETITGQHYFGSLEKTSESGKKVVITDPGDVILALIDIVRIYPIEATFLKRIKGDLDVGFSYQKASDLTQWTLGLVAKHRSKKWQSTISGSSYFSLSGQNDEKDTKRNELMYDLRRIYQRRWFGSGFVKGEQNDELDLALRIIGGLGVGRFFIQTNKNIVTGTGGLAVSREKFTETNEFRNNLEVMLSGRHEFFRYNDPQLNVSTTVKFFASLTELGRIRINFASRIGYEIFHNFYFGIRVFDKYDNRSGADRVSKNDFGIDTTISWSFK